MVDRSLGRNIFRIINTLFFIIYGIICLIPIVHTLAVSLSSSMAARAGKVVLWPVEFNLHSYEFILKNDRFWKAMSISGERMILGVSISLILTILAAYPLSKSKDEFRARDILVWLFLFTMIFSGGMIPSYMIVRYTGLIDTIWALVIPGAVPVFNLLILINFFKGIPREMEEAAFIDGASHWTILWKIFVPMSLPAIATLAVFSIVGHWNSWFDGLIYMNSADNYPLQTYLQSLLVEPTSRVISRSEAIRLRFISEKTVRNAQIFVGAIPVLLIYPFLQRYFVAGIVLGGVKE
ncbi:carbohydrate ABC transporter permease [Mahella australiensis]|uniref:Binding-protein-dependent transport systems inner membrane component n=1 Tax=Mahella australiensis (strain DSM 15567 / CIP 107919 / 50-1 BON) TaxID=697281 RepID=F3ZZP6_MAHA5|nr:carbohydrate ABC transporter permease [Mahella australiensis]AEE97893.1 binding-protein-dependent transport systems inner membrane component [Mahella australiensis 50-1 BON]